MAAEAEWKTRNDPQRDLNSKESAHFRILYGNERPANRRVEINDAMLEGNLRYLEEIYDFYVNEMGLRDIGRPRLRDTGTKYKCNIYISDTGIGKNGKWAEAHVDGAYDQGWYGNISLNQDAMDVSNTLNTVLPHELAHVFMTHQKGLLAGDWNEPMANFFSNEWQKSDRAKKYKGGQRTQDFGLFAQNTEWRYPSVKKWYEIFPVLTYIYENPDHISGLGKQGFLKMLQDGTDDKSYYYKMERVTGVEIKKILCGTIRRLITMDFDKSELYQGTLNKVKKDMFTSLEDAGEGWQKVPDGKMPQQTGFNIIPLKLDLKKTSVTVELETTSTSPNAGHTASIVTVTNSETNRYSDMWSGGAKSVKLRGDEKEAYLVVVATPRELEALNVYITGYTPDDRDTERYPYKVKITQGEEIEEDSRNIAPSAKVQADYFNGNASPAKVNDGKLAGHDSSGTWNTWCNEQNKTYPYPITLEWDKKQSLSGMKIMWWADDANPGDAMDGVLFPKSCEVQYYDEEQKTWKKITGMTDETSARTDSVGVKYGTSSSPSANTGEYLLGNNRYWNEVKFPEKIVTTKLRLFIDRQDKVSGHAGIGIGEWKVYGEAAAGPNKPGNTENPGGGNVSGNPDDSTTSGNTKKPEETGGYKEEEEEDGWSEEEGGWIDIGEEGGFPSNEQLENKNPGLPTGNSEESKKARFSKLAARVEKSTKNTNKLKWNKVKGAQGYIVFGNKCNSGGKKYKVKVLKTTGKNTTSYTHKKLKKGTYYKYVVQAYKKVNGKIKILSVSKTIHSATTGGKYGNPGSLKLNKTKITLKKGKKFTIKTKETARYKKPKKHRSISYESTNTKVAQVSTKGVIKAKKKGSCYVYVYAQNGVYKRIKVTVK